MEKDTNTRTNVQMKFYELEEGGKFLVDDGGNVRVSSCSLTPEFQRGFLGKVLNAPDTSLESSKEKLATDDKGGFSTIISIKVDGKVALEAESRYGKSTLVYNPELLNQVIEKVNTQPKELADSSIGGLISDLKDKQLSSYSNIGSYHRPCEIFQRLSILMEACLMSIVK